MQIRQQLIALALGVVATSCEHQVTAPPTAREPEASSMPTLVMSGEPLPLAGRFTATVPPSSAEATIIDRIAAQYPGEGGRQMKDRLTNRVAINPANGMLTITVVSVPDASPAHSLFQQLESVHREEYAAHTTRLPPRTRR